MTVTQVSTTIRKLIWRVHPAKRIITIDLQATPRASAWPPDPTAVNPVSDRPACTPAPLKEQSLFLVWKTSAVTPGPVCHPMEAAPSPPCSQWSGCPTSTSPLTSPQGLWCPDLVGWEATPLHSWATVITRPCTRALWPTRHWAASAVPEPGSSHPQLAYRETSTSIRMAFPVRYHHISTILYIVSASCQNGMITAKGVFLETEKKWKRKTRKDQSKAELWRIYIYIFKEVCGCSSQ